MGTKFAQLKNDLSNNKLVFVMFLMYNFHLSLAALCNFVSRSFIDVLKPDLVSVVTVHRV